MFYQVLSLLQSMSQVISVMSNVMSHDMSCRMSYVIYTYILYSILNKYIYVKLWLELFENSWLILSRIDFTMNMSCFMYVMSHVMWYHITCHITYHVHDTSLKKKIVEKDLTILHWIQFFNFTIMCYQMTFAYHVMGHSWHTWHSTCHVTWYVLCNDKCQGKCLVTCGMYITLNETKHVIWNLTCQ